MQTQESTTAIRLGIIGLGAMGSRILRVATAEQNIQVIAAVDPQESILPDFLAQFPEIEFSTDSDSVAKSEKIDALYIAVPPKFHARYALTALHYGKHVFCEKPLSVSLDEGTAMVQQAAESGLVNAVNFALSDRNSVLEIERALDANELGEIKEVTLRLVMPEWPRAFQRDALWLSGREQGGVLREVFSHFAQLSDQLFGDLKAGDSSVTFPDIGQQEAETAATANFYAGNQRIQLSALTGVAAPETYEYTIYGTLKSYRLSNWGDLLVSFGDAWQPVSLAAPLGGDSSRLRTFADAVRISSTSKTSGVPRQLPDFATALRVQKLVERILEE